jgi:hypothetical protein
MMTPSWVPTVVQAVAMNYGRKSLPEIRWRTKEGRTCSSGCYHREVVYARWGRRKNYRPAFISITAGSDIEDQMLVLLHELAHWLNPRCNHTVKFWNTAFDLYDDFKIPTSRLMREFRYKDKAFFVYLYRLEVIPYDDVSSCGDIVPAVSNQL